MYTVIHIFFFLFGYFSQNFNFMLLIKNAFIQTNSADMNFSLQIHTMIEKVCFRLLTCVLVMQQLQEQSLQLKINYYCTVFFDWQKCSISSITVDIGKKSFKRTLLNIQSIEIFKWSRAAPSHLFSSLPIHNQCGGFAVT